jgi:predicted HTH domain antitoxin
MGVTPLNVRHLTGRVDREQVEMLDRISREEKIDRSAALRKILDVGIREYMKRKAVERYRCGAVSIGKAAEESGVSIAEFYRILEDEGIPVKVDTAAIQEASESNFEE